MTAGQMQGVICFVLGVVAIATFMLKGKQYPTFITAGLFGMYAGSTEWGGAIMRAVSNLAVQVIGAMS